jgi:hypothetical protein
MKQMKKIAALLIVVMLISMLSCFAFSASASTNLGGPVKIEKIAAGEGGILVGGSVNLPRDVFVVNSDWMGESGARPIKLGNTVYRVILGENGFSSIGEAAAAAQKAATIYVAAGLYDTSASINVGGLKIYGPYAGVCPNMSYDLKVANPNRPAASGGSTETEAVITGTISASKPGSDLLVDGLYFTGNGGLGSSLTDSENYRYGMTIQNCVVDTKKGTLIAFPSGNNPSFEFKNNRVLNGKGILNISGLTDVTIVDNYFNTTGVTVTMLNVLAGSMGSYAKIARNYYENCGGMFYYENPYQTVLYNVVVQDNYVNDMGAAPIVHNMFYARHTLPGTNIQVTGNTFLKMDAGAVPFRFPYDATQDNPNRFRHIININENYFDLPANTKFVESAMNGVLNLANNYYSTPVTVDRIEKYENTDLILYPYYLDKEMTITAGGPKLDLWDANLGEVDHDQRLIVLDYYGTELDYIELDKALKVEDGCTWKLYEEETLEKEIRDKKFYFEGTSTERYAEVVAADGAAKEIYKIRAFHDTGLKAELLGLNFSNSRVKFTKDEVNTFVYNFPADVAFVDFDIKVSSGATYELYKTCDQSGRGTEAYPALGQYIPYGGFQFNVVVTAEDGGEGNAEKQVYTVIFNRDKSSYYDPSIVSVKAPEGGRLELRKGMVSGKLSATYYCPYLLNAATFDLEVTPGATYTIYKEEACTTVLSSSSNKKEIKLNDGASTLYVKVDDGKNVNVIPLTIQNVKKSSNATITALEGLSARINNNVISFQSSSDNASVKFLTASPYATVKVFADAAKTVEVKYSSSRMEDRDHPNQFIDERTFSLDVTHALSYYYVVCTAEDGTTVQNYKLIVDRLAQKKVYKDITDDDWFYSYVAKASDAGILQGSPVEKEFIFRPADNTTRQEMAIIASRLLGINCGAFEDVKLPYKDLSSIADWSLGYVKVAYKMGIMKGDGTNFNPGAPITRQEAMAMFARMYGLKGSADLTQFKDHAQVASWAKAEVEAVVAEGIIEGYDGYLNPTASITRAEIATIISRVI